MKYSELVKILRKHKCRIIRHGANHDIWFSPLTQKQFEIPRHRSQEVKTGIANAIFSPSPLQSISAQAPSFVTYIACDTMVYRKHNLNRAVKKTLSIPEWMNEAATEAGFNFSQVLQEALSEKLDALS